MNPEAEEIINEFRTQEMEIPPVDFAKLSPEIREIIESAYFAGTGFSSNKNPEHTTKNIEFCQVSLPAEMITEINLIIKKEKWMGFEDPDEFLREAVRENILRYNPPKKQ
jgi:hypothetical protein